MAQPEIPKIRVLIRGVNWLGDAVMTTPALQRLRQAMPGAHLSLLTPENLAGLWLNHPSLDAVITFSPTETPSAVARKLRREHFDTALILPNSPRSALEAWLARIPERIGVAGDWRRWLLTRVVHPRPGAIKMIKRSAREVRRLAGRHSSGGAAGQQSRDPVAHQSLHYLHLASALGASPEPLPPVLRVTDEEIRAAALKHGLPMTILGSHPPLFALAPGAHYGPAKRWPLERFAAAARELQRRCNCQWLILGGESDRPLAEELVLALGTELARAEATPVVYNLAGRTSLRDLCALLRISRVLLTNDSGPMHVAAALGTPVVALFGSTSPSLTGPGLPGDPRHHLLSCVAPCAPCFRRVCPIDFRCMKGIAVDEVISTVLAAAGSKTT